MTSPNHSYQFNPPRIGNDPDRTIGRILQKSGKLSSHNVERVLRVMEELGIRFGETAVRLGLIGEQDIQEALAEQFDYPYITSGRAGLASELIAAYKPFALPVETLRAIRTELMLRWFNDGTRKALAIASSENGEGTSLFVANLAVVFAQLGVRTLLVDANLRQPRQHLIFDLQSRAGLSEVLVGRAGLETIVKVDSLSDLSILPAGTIPPNPQELISSAAFQAFSSSLDGRFDVILYDTAPFSSSSDAFSMVASVGGVLLVVRKQFSRVAQINDIARRLKRNRSNIVGSVLVDF
jgi:protein-tyrosine kinase